MSRTYFTDRDPGKQFPAALAAAGISVEAHATHFAHDTADPDWLRDIGRRGWIAITHDRRIRYKPNELAAVKEHVVALLVTVGQCPMREHAHAPPLIAKIYRVSSSELDRDPRAPGRVERWYP